MIKENSEFGDELLPSIPKGTQDLQTLFESERNEKLIQYSINAVIKLVQGLPKIKKYISAKLKELCDTSSPASRFASENALYGLIGGPLFLYSGLKNKHFRTKENFKTTTEKTIVWGIGISGTLAHGLLGWELLSDYDYDSVKAVILEINYEAVLDYLSTKKDEALIFGVLKMSAYGGLTGYSSLVLPRRLKDELLK